MKTGIQDSIQAGLEPYSYVTAAYLLGSAVTGRMRPDSDIDLAVLIGSGDGLDWERRLQMASELEQLVGRSLDLGVLSSDNLIYAREAILKGECVFCRDAGLRDTFAMRVLGLYGELRNSRKEVEAAYACR